MADSYGIDGDTGATEEGEEGIDEEPEEEPLPESCGDGEFNDEGELCLRLEPAIDAGIDPCSLSVGDLDEDGHIDFAVPNSDFAALGGGTYEANVLLGTGTGSFDETVAWPAGPELPVGLALGDVDADGLLDIVTSNYASLTLQYLQNLGNADFAAPAAMATEDMTFVSVHPGNLDGDPFSEMIAIASSVLIARGGPDGPGPLFELPDSSAWGPRYALATDLNADGQDDLVVSSSDGVLRLIPTLAGGSFGPPVEVPVLASAWVDAGDFDEDGHPDLVVVDDGGGALTIVTTDGNFGVKEIIEPNTPQTTAQSVAVGDLNLDGHLDVALAVADEDWIRILLGNGEGGLEFERYFTTGLRPVSVRIADLNEDGAPDVAWANQLGNTVQVALSDY